MLRTGSHPNGIVGSYCHYGYSAYPGNHVNVYLYTQTEITERNQLQQEAQLIMEQITSAMQDGAIWCQEGTALVLKAPMLAEGQDDTPGDCTGEDLIRYERAKQTLHYVKDSANILLSSNIQDLVLDPEPSNHELTEQAVRLVLEKNKQTYEVKTKITYQRF